MSKRSREDASVANGRSVVPDSKKRKRQRTENPTVVDQPTPAIPVAVGRDTGPPYADPKARKRAKKEEERRSRKMGNDASKLARLAEKACKTEPGVMEPELHTNATTQGVDETAISKKERKAMKKSREKAKAAERAAKDEARAARKGQDYKSSLNLTADADGVGESDTAPSTALDPTADSSVPSKAPSSVTSPEPDMTGSASRNYVQAEALKALPQSEIDGFLDDNGIDITDPTSTSYQYRPITSFSHLPVTDPALRTPFASFVSPTPIQATAWPFALAGRDVIGVAETGSGKTLAFGLPCVQYISSLGKKERNGIKAVMVSPTRELAVQINEQLIKLAEPAGLKTACVYGGVPKDEQRLALKRAHIVIATPGRLTDLIDEGAAKLNSVGYLVLDEADRMLDKGFEDAIREIINCLPPTPSRQTLMFTATWPQSVRELASTFMTTPVKISIGDNHTGELRANTRISQTVEVVDPHNKQFRLLQLLKDHIAHGKTKKGTSEDTKILVFCLYKKEATRIEGFIRSKGFRVAGIHGDLSQAQRMTSLDAFKQGRVPILVATDVAARGLDIPDVSLVINVTFPLTAEDYVHRIGRTGRAGKEGKAVTLFTDHDKALAGALINVLKAANQPVPEALLKFGTTVKKKAHDAYGAFYKDTGGMKQATKITFD